MSIAISGGALCPIIQVKPPIESELVGRSMNRLSEEEGCWEIIKEKVTVSLITKWRNMRQSGKLFPRYCISFCG